MKNSLKNIILPQSFENIKIIIFLVMVLFTSKGLLAQNVNSLKRISITEGVIQIQKKRSNSEIVDIGYIEISASRGMMSQAQDIWIGSKTPTNISFTTNNIRRVHVLNTGQTIISKYGYISSGASIDFDKFDKYSLFTYGGILSEDYWLNGHENWSDFVFEKNYTLMPLNELEDFIKKNKHLPNIPTQQEVMEVGYSLHDLNTSFLEKIEELTLYTIAQEKKINHLETQLKQFQTMKKEIEELKELLKDN